jgi:hypothetical protein
MKNFLIVFCGSLLIFFGCQRKIELNDEHEYGPSFKIAKEYLREQLNQNEYSQLDWAHATHYSKEKEIEIISVPQKGTIKKSAFVFLDDNNVRANWVTFESNKIISESLNHFRIGTVNVDLNGNVTKIKIYENNILIYEKDKLLAEQSQTRNAVFAIEVPGYIQGPDNTTLWLAELLGIGQPSWSIYENFQAPYQYLEPPGEEGSYGQIYVDVVFNYDDKPSIDLTKFFNCFNNVPDNGATYTIKLCADLPIDGQPWWMEDWFTPGHSFLTVTKTNGSQSVTQNFGFYPVSGLRSIWGNPCTSKLIDDGNHEFEASISMTITQTQFNTMKDLALSYISSDYDINDFNCADFALNCFNSARSTPLDVPDTQRTFVNYGTTPNGIYEKLKDMKDNNHVEAANIFIGETNAPSSQGECN